MALQRLREPKAAFPVWIDAICINQEDLDEKNGQVTKMGEIYSMAKTVHVWLELSDWRNVIYLWAYGLLDRLLIIPTRLELLVRVLLSPTIYRSKWCTRVWTLQELAFANKLVFMVGGAKYRSTVSFDLKYIFRNEGTAYGRDMAE